MPSRSRIRRPTRPEFHRPLQGSGMTDLPIWLTGLLLIVVLPAAVVVIQIVLRRHWPALRQGDHNEVAGFIIAVVGVIYAVLLAFVVIVSWENFSHAEQVVGDEASALRTIYRDSGAFPPELRDQLHGDVRRYAVAVVDVEWPAMARGEPGSPEVTRILDETSQTLATMPITTPAQQQYQGIEAERFNDLVTARSHRLDFVEQGVPVVLWIALIVGAVVTIGFALIFGMRSTLLHTLMTASLSALIGVLLFVAVAIDHPFAGDVAVHPAPLERVLSDFGEQPN
ncbi:bestrophin-like domain [Actinomycetospora sp. C-140]